MVITSGGVGPTHDDKTYEAVARAFRVPLLFNAEVAETVAAAHGLDGQRADGAAAAPKMAMLPEGCRLHHVLDTRGTTISKPIVQVNNVFVFPGRS